MDYKQCPACTGSAKRHSLIIRQQTFSICSKCKTLWLSNGYLFNNYDSQYIHNRGHDASSLIINNAKKHTFRKFWSKLGKMSGPVLEIGCSTGLSLKAAQDIGLDIYGLDVNDDIIKFVERWGISRKRVSVNGLKVFNNKRFKAVAFFDSFEHIPDPEVFLSELVNYLADGAIIIMVIPDGGAFTRKLLGRYWPHYCEDHWVHYTRIGLETLFSRYRIETINTFNPIKYVPVEMVIRHIAINWNIPIDTINKFKPILPITLHFNIGEMGLIWRYRKG